MKIIISGYGKMGREIEIAALDRGHDVIARISQPNEWDTYLDLLSQADVVIDFSTPAAAVDNIRRCFDMNLPVVTGTTGWNEMAGQVKKWCEEEHQSLFTASNFSIGVNMLFVLTQQLADMIDLFDDYDISIEEIHHIHKLDAPSGTALKLAGLILERVKRKKNWINSQKPDPEELQITSLREGEIAGIHTITCESQADRLIFRHEAKGRKGFATGALLAAEWLKGKKGYYEMKDLLPFMK